MKKSDVSQRLFELSVNAGMNQRVHHSKSGKFETKEKNLQVGLAIVAAIGMILSCVPSSTLDASGYGVLFYVAGIFLSGLSVVLAVWLNVNSWARMAAIHQALFVRWSDFRAAVDAEHFRLHAESHPELEQYVRRIVDLSRWGESIDTTEPHCDNEELKKFQAEEWISRGLKHPSIPEPE